MSSIICMLKGFMLLARYSIYLSDSIKQKLSQAIQSPLLQIMESYSVKFPQGLKAKCKYRHW